jgi:hypothetical protein
MVCLVLGKEGKHRNQMNESRLNPSPRSFIGFRVFLPRFFPPTKKKLSQEGKNYVL